MSDTVSPAEHHHRRREFVREAVTMALYLSLSVLAVLLAIPTNAASDPVGLVFLTAVGLLVAHLLAFSISSRLVSRGLLDTEAQLIVGAQIAAGVFVIGLVMLPLLVFQMPVSVQAAEGLLLGFVVWIGYLAARQADISRFRSWLYVATVVVGVLIVLVLKAAVGH